MKESPEVRGNLLTGKGWEAWESDKTATPCTEDTRDFHTGKIENQKSYLENH